VLDGALRAAVPDAEGGERVVAEFRRGGTVGELALVTGAARTATVYAVRDSDLARIPRDGFLELIERRPQAALKVARSVCQRGDTQADAAAERRRSAGGTIGLLASGPTAPLDELARELVARLAPHGGALLLTSAAVDAALGRAGIAQAAESDPSHLRFTQWIFEQEETHRYVLLVADPAWTRWSERCARSTDQLVTIADATASPELGELEARLTSSLLAGRDPQRSLVLVHPPAIARPVATSRWLRERNVDDVYHLRRGREDDLGRLATEPGRPRGERDPRRRRRARVRPPRRLPGARRVGRAGGSRRRRQHRRRDGAADCAGQRRRASRWRWSARASLRCSTTRCRSPRSSPADGSRGRSNATRRTGRSRISGSPTSASRRI
jgi:hypothetical protein